jgi:hypothetical protein
MSEHIPFVPTCARCGVPLPYRGAAHGVSERCLFARGWWVPPGVERSVRRLYALRPSIFGRSPWSRWHVFHHLFFVNGTGYGWYHGELVREDEQRRWWWDRWLMLPRVQSDQDEARRAMAWRQAHGVRSSRSELHEQASIRQNWNRLARMPERFYPLSQEHSPLATMPADVRRDWLAAALDVCNMFEWVIARFGDGEGNAPLVRKIKSDLLARSGSGPSSSSSGGENGGGEPSVWLRKV